MEPPLVRLIKFSGLVLILFYCLLNLANIIYFRFNISFIGMLLASVAGTYFLQSFVRYRAGNIQISTGEIAGFSLIGFGFMILLAQNLLHEPYVGFDGINVQRNLLTLFIVSTLWFFIGGAFAAANVGESPFWALFIGIGISLLMGFGVTEDLFKSYDTVNSAERDQSISHLNVERYIIIPLMFAYALSSKARWVVALCGFYSLFLLGGRTALVVFIVSLILVNLTKNSLRNIVAMLVLGAVIYYGLQYAMSIGLIDPENKNIQQLFFSEGIAEDNSFQSRVILLGEGLQDLPSQFFIGHFSITAQRHGQFGRYIHNILSAWQFYGFFFFTALIGCLIFCVKDMRKQLRVSRSPLTIFSSFVLIYVIISVVIGKYAAWTMLWFALGLWLLRPILSRNGQPADENKKKRRKRKRRSKKKSMFGSLFKKQKISRVDSN